MKVVPFEPSSNDEAVKDLLADLTALIESGQVEAFSYAAVQKDYTVDIGWTGTRLGSLLGAVVRLTHRINLKADEG